MGRKTKGKRYWFYLGDTERSRVDHIKARCVPLQDSDILGMVVASALRAIGDGPISLPLEFTLKKAAESTPPPPHDF